MDLSVALLHEGMWDKSGRIVTTSLTLIDLHDIARSCTTYGVKQFFIVHPNESMRKLAETLQVHWEQGYGSRYNTTRKEAFQILSVLSNLDEALNSIKLRTGEEPVIVATSAKEGEQRVTFSDYRKIIRESKKPHLMLLGTGWGMAEELLKRTEICLEPIRGCGGEYNHLSVRSACAILLDRIVS